MLPSKNNYYLAGSHLDFAVVVILTTGYYAVVTILTLSSTSASGSQFS